MIKYKQNLKHLYAQAQCCPTLGDPIDYSLPGSSVHAISQTRILEWVATSSPRDLPNQGIKTGSPDLAGRFFTSEPSGKPQVASTPGINSVLIFSRSHEPEIHLEQRAHVDHL